MKKKIFLISSVVFIILVCVVMYLFNKIVLNSEERDVEITETIVDNETTITKNTKEKNNYIFAGYLGYLKSGSWVWSSDEALEYLTDNFKDKYINYYDIYPELKNKIGGISDTEVLNDKGDKIRIEFTWQDENDKKKMSRVEYDLTLTDDGKIDDCKIVNVIYYDPVTYNPLDGRPITLNIEDVRLYIGVLWRPGHYMLDEDVGDRIFKKYVDIPKSEDCQIINLPKEPLECEGNLPYFKAIYGKNKLSDDFEIIGIDISSIKYYKVEYDINDKAQFTRIEFKEITEDEYNEGIKR